MKIIVGLFSLFLLFSSLSALGQTPLVHSDERDRALDYGIGLGSAVAITISWSRNKSVLYAIIHGIFGGLYVIYFLIARKNESPGKS